MGKVWVGLAIVVALALAVAFALNYLAIDLFPTQVDVPAEYE